MLKPQEETLEIDDMEKVFVNLMNIDKKIFYNTQSEYSYFNVSSKKEIIFKDHDKIIADVIGFKEKINFDPIKHDGIIRKLLDSKLINNFSFKSLGFKSKTNLKDGLIKTHQEYLKT